MPEMSKAEKRGHATDLKNSPLLNEILDGLENEAIDMVINAKPGEDEKRASYALQARAIRELRSRIENCLDETEFKPKVIA